MASGGSVRRFRVGGACGEDWARMEPRAGGRRCARCEHVVVDLTDTTRARAEAIVRVSGERLCVRMRVDALGDAIFREPALVPLRRAVSGLAVAALVAACEPSAASSGPAETRVEAPLEPTVIDLGPPMLPIERGGGSPEPAPVASCAAGDAGATAQRGEGEAHEQLGEEAHAERGEPTPTADQRARTRRKRQRQARSARAHTARPPDVHMGFLL